MIFPHLSSVDPRALMASLEALTPLEPSLPPAICSATLEEKPKSNPVNFRFSEADQVMAELQQAGICDAFGEPCAPFDYPDMLTFSYEHPEIQHIINQFLQDLDETLQLHNPYFTNGSSLTVSFKLIQLFSVLASQQVITQADGKLSVLPPLADIESFGRGLLQKIGTFPFWYTAQTFFSSGVESKRIATWFTKPHVQQQFLKIGKDDDIRVIAYGSLPSLIFLSKYTGSYFAALLPELTHQDVYEAKLKEKNPDKYSSPENYDLKEALMIEFGGLSKRKIVNKPPTQYTILGLDLAGRKPLDLVFVRGKQNGQLSLEYPCLSSLTCWTLSLSHIHLQRHLTIGCRPFTASKALIDLLCETTTILNPDVDAWCRFMHEPWRSMQSTIEQEMVQNTLQFKYEFLEERHKRLHGPNPEYPANLDISDSQYISDLLEEQIHTKYVDSQTKQVDSSAIIGFLFRACQSLRTHSSLSDQEIFAIWQKFDQKGWLSISENQSDQHLLMALKKALIDEKTPFSVVSAWMGLLMWLYTPHLATTHGCRSVFRLRTPELGFLPIQPVKDDQTIRTYLARHSCPAAFQELQSAMTTLFPFSFNSSLLLPSLSDLNLNSSILLEMATKWHQHTSPLLNSLSLHLFLSSLDPAIDQATLRTLVRKLFLQRTVRSQDISAFFKILEKLIPHTSPAYTQALQTLKLKPALSKFDWIDFMLQSKDPDLLHLSYSWWKTQENLPRNKIPLERGWKIFNELCLRQPSCALSFLQTIHRRHLLSPQQEGKYILQLLQAYQKHAPEQLSCDVDRLLPFLYFLFEQIPPYPFTPEDSQILLNTVDTLQTIPVHQVTADYFLLEMSRRHCLQPEDQTERWLRRLESSVAQSSEVLYCMSLYHVVMQEGIIDREKANKERIQTLQIALAENLLQAQQKKLSLALFEHVFQDIREELRTLITFYEWALNWIAIESESIHSFPLEFLEILIVLTPPHKREEVQEKFRSTFASTTEKLQKKDQTAATLTENLPFSQMDQFLIRPELKSLINQAATEEEWKTLLFDYLETTLAIDPANRFPTLWTLCEQLMGFMHKTQDTKPNLRLFKLISNLLEQSPQPPSPKSLTWITTQHLTILKKLQENRCPNEAASFILNLNRHAIPHGSLISYVWWLCEHEFSLSPPSASRLKQLISMEKFEDLSKHIPSTFYFQVPHLIACLQPVLTTEELWPWLDFYFNTVIKETSQPKLTDEKQQTQLNEAFLMCAQQSIEKKNWSQTFQVLKHIPESSPTQISEGSSIQIPEGTSTQRQRLQAFWKTLLTEWQPSPSVTIVREILLGSQVRAAFSQEEDQLKPFAIATLHRYLDSSSPTKEERKLAFDLLITYQIKDDNLWLLLWKSIKSPLNTEDKALVREIWPSYKTQTSSSTPSLARAECWALAFTLLVDCEHEDLIPYYEDPSLLSPVFSDPLSSPSKRKALEGVLLRAIHQLSLSTFDQAAFDQVVKKKTDFAASWRAENLDMSPTDSNLLTEWENRVDLALITCLQHSRHPAALLAIGQLLQPFLQRSSIYLPYLQEIITHYFSLKKETRLAALQADVTLKEREKDFWISTTSHLQTMCQQETVSCFSLLSLLTVLTTHASTEHVDLQIQLCTHILNKGSVQEIEKSKASFLIAFSTLITSPTTQDLETAKIILETAFKKMKLSLQEKGKLSYQFLTATYDYTLKSVASDPDDVTVETLLTVYQSWAPYLFAHADLLQNVIDRSLDLIHPYACVNPCNRVKTDQFTKGLRRILDTKNQVALTTSPPYQTCLKQYASWVMQSSKKKNPIKVALLQTLHQYIDDHLEKKPAPNPAEMRDLLHTFIYMYPLSPAIKIPNLPPHARVANLSHSGYSEKLLKKAYQKGCFKGYLDDLIEYELYFNLNICPTNQVTIKHKDHCERVLNRLLSQNTSFCFHRAITVASYLQSVLINTRQYDVFTPHYTKLFNALKSHIRDSKQVEPLFDYLIQRLLYNYPNQDTIQSQHQISKKVFPLFWQAARHYLDECLKHPVDHFYLYYLDACLTLLQYQSDHKLFTNGNRDYFKLLKEFMPFVKKAESVKERGQIDLSALSRKWQAAVPKLTVLVQRWTERLIHPTIVGEIKTLSENDQQHQRKMLKEWLKCLCQIGPHDDPLLVCDSLTITLIKVITPHITPSSPWLDAGNPEDKALFESIGTLIQNKGAYRHKLAFATHSFQFYAHHTKDFELYLQKVEKYIDLLEECTVKKESFPISEDFLNIILVEPEDPITYFSKRQALFFRFLSALKTLVPQASADQSRVEAHALLMNTLERGIDQKFLDEKYPEARKHFNWTKQILDRTYAPALQLLSLISQRRSLFRMKDDYLAQISGIMPAVGQYMVDKDDLTPSTRLVHLILDLPLSRQEHLHYLKSWHKVYVNLCPHFKDQVAFNFHLHELERIGHAHEHNIPIQLNT